MNDRRGFALLATLWLIVMLTALAATAAESGWSYRRATLNRLDAAITEAAARGGLAHAQAVLSEVVTREARRSDQTFLFPAADAWRQMDVALGDSVVLDGTQYSVGLSDAGARLNLNVASEQELRQLLLALRVDAGRADRVAQAFADWRDADDFRRGRGAEVAEYLAQGARALPRNGTLAEVGELRDVSGVDDKLFDRIEPFVTVRGSGIVNLNAAELPVLLSLPGVGEEAANAILRARERHRPFQSLNDLQEALSPSARARLTPALPELLPRVGFATREVLISATATRTGSNIRTLAEALCVVDGRHVFRTAEWVR